MKSVALYCVYALALFNVSVWQMWPELFSAVVWQWDIFVVLIFTPLILRLESE